MPALVRYPDRPEAEPPRHLTHQAITIIYILAERAELEETLKPQPIPILDQERFL